MWMSPPKCVLYMCGKSHANTKCLLLWLSTLFCETVSRCTWSSSIHPGSLPNKLEGLTCLHHTIPLALGNKYNGAQLLHGCCENILQSSSFTIGALPTESSPLPHCVLIHGSHIRHASPDDSSLAEFLTPHPTFYFIAVFFFSLGMA